MSLYANVNLGNNLTCNPQVRVGLLLLMSEKKTRIGYTVELDRGQAPRIRLKPLKQACQQTEGKKQQKK